MSDGSYIVLSILALTSRANALCALSMTWLFAMLNGGIAHAGPNAAAARYVVVLAAASSVFARSGFLRRVHISIPVGATFLLGAFFSVHGLSVSYAPDVSVLKAVAWTIAMGTSLSAWRGLNLSERQRTEKIIFGGLTTVLIMSLPLLFTETGFRVNGSGFQGILNHPQAFGATTPLLGAWAIGMLLAKRNGAWSLLLLALVCILFTVLSEARTGAFALLLAIPLAIVTIPVISGRPFFKAVPGLLSSRSFVGMAGLLILIATSGPTIYQHIDSFLAKRTETATLFQAYDRSRGIFIEPMLNNIAHNPVRGIGFGVASDPSMLIVNRDPVLGLPVNASIEKGVLPLAVFEEVGVFGAIFVFLWLVMLARRAGRGGGIAHLAVMYVAILLNMGEFILFSPGGQGLLTILLLGWASSRAGYPDSSDA